MTLVNKLLVSASLLATSATILGFSKPASSPADDLLGTWEEVTIKHMKTGTVDTDINHRVNWSCYTKSHIFYAAMARDRKATDPAALGKLPDAEKMKIRYAWVWNDKPGPSNYGSFGSSYTWSGDTLTYNFEVAMNPAQVSHPSRERVVRVDRNTLIIHTLPDADGNWNEETWRRLD